VSIHDQLADIFTNIYLSKNANFLSNLAGLNFHTRLTSL
jgi:hypothetical protein